MTTRNGLLQSPEVQEQFQEEFTPLDDGKLNELALKVFQVFNSNYLLAHVMGEQSIQYSTVIHLDDKVLVILGFNGNEYCDLLGIDNTTNYSNICKLIPTLSANSTDEGATKYITSIHSKIKVDRPWRIVIDDQELVVIGCYIPDMD